MNDRPSIDRSTEVSIEEASTEIEEISTEITDGQRYVH